jgi:hypothetical protein
MWSGSCNAARILNLHVASCVGVYPLSDQGRILVRVRILLRITKKKIWAERTYQIGWNCTLTLPLMMFHRNLSRNWNKNSFLILSKMPLKMNRMKGKPKLLHKIGIIWALSVTDRQVDMAFVWELAWISSKYTYRDSYLGSPDHRQSPYRLSHVSPHSVMDTPK